MIQVLKLFFDKPGGASALERPPLLETWLLRRLDIERSENQGCRVKQMDEMRVHWCPANAKVGDVMPESQLPILSLCLLARYA